uniref:G-protein coupled receptors family 1 profile domain-containing protein n=1 Tax=Felis catus TaxID=9685 RepID=A0ABI7XN74_FELCA
MCSIPVKNAIGILTGIAPNLYIALGSMDVLTILILPAHEHRISFHLFVSSSTSLVIVFQFSVHRCFISLVKFIPRYLILFDASVNMIVLSISLSDSSLLVYTNGTDFCLLILYPSVSLKFEFSFYDLLFISFESKKGMH